MNRWMSIVIYVGVLTAVTAEDATNTTQFIIDYDAWWGPSDQSDLYDTSITRFNITFEDDMIADLRNRLSRYRQSNPPLESALWTMGVNTDHLGEWIQYWAEEYPFAERATYFNQYSHFWTNIQGLKIHFINEAPVNTNKRVVPLLMTHGWPGSVREFYELIPMLTADNDDWDFVFNVTVASIPGFGYSDAAVRPGMGCNEIAVILMNLMRRLGHDKFVYYGGDWGAWIGANMATLYPESVIGYHTNFPAAFTTKAVMMMGIGEFLPELVVEESLASRLYPLTDSLSWLVTETGYLHYQATKPDTLGIAMSDSPVGLMAHIFNMMSSMTRKSNVNTTDGGLEQFYTREQLFDNLMTYWATNKITSSFRIYAESYNKRTFQSLIPTTSTEVPSWVLQAPDEMVYMSPVMWKTKMPNLLGVTVLEEGGHFISLEKPKVLADDLFKATDAFLKWREDAVLNCEL